MVRNKPQLIVALDVSTLAETKDLIDTLSPVVDIFKIGSRIFTACGPAVVRFVQAREKKVFLDLKYHDIPNTVAGAVKSAVGLTIKTQTVLKDDGTRSSSAEQGTFMLTVHTAGGKEMLEAAVKAAKDKAQELKIRRPLVVGITVLTSEKKEDSMESLVLKRSLLAREAGLDGVVASVDEAAMIRQELGSDFVIVTPGIRPQGSGNDDQKRIATPSEAVSKGADFLVVGRPVIQSKDPLVVAKKILEEINN